MRRPSTIDRPVFMPLAVACIAAAWCGCTASPDAHTTTTSSTGQGGSTSSSSTGGTGGIGVSLDGGGGGDDAGACTSTSAEAHRVPLDIVFLIDKSGSMNYNGRWTATTAGLTTFFNDPASVGISAGLVLFPHSDYDCVPQHYETLDVPINVLPQNTFALTNSMPAEAHGIGTPMYGALEGALMAATAHQDAHPDHKVIVVLATDGYPDGCTATVDEIAALAKGARNYNGVLTYTISVDTAALPVLNKISVAGGTTAPYDITQDISQFFAKITEIRNEALGCDFAIPPPPQGMQVDPNQVNFSYTPKGTGSPKILPRADDLADCNGQPGWYYDSNTAPTKIVLCPSSCTTVEADNNAKVSVLFGCKSVAQ